MKLGIPPLGQRDARWKDIKLGNSTTRTIGTDGCLLVCHTMMLNYYGHSFNPATLNTVYKEGGAFSGALLIFHKPAEIISDLTADEMYNCPTTPCDTSKIDKYLNEKKPVIAWVDNVGNDNAPDHFVLIIGKDENNKYLVNDPWTGETVYFHAVWGDDPARYIYGLRLYSGPVPEDDCQTKLAEAQANLEETNRILSEKADEVSILQGQIRDKDAKIQTLQETADKKRVEHSEEIYQKDKKIAELQLVADKVSLLENKVASQEEQIAKLKKELTECNKKNVDDYNLITFILYKYLKK